MLVEDTLNGLLTGATTAAEEQAAAEVFLAGLTPHLLAALAAYGESAAAVPLLSAAADHLRSDDLAHARDDLIAALAAVRRAPSKPVVSASEVCDVCERVAPCWSVPITGATVELLPGLAAPATLLVCQTCRELIGDTATDEELADLLGLDRLPRTLRGLHARINGRPMPWPADQDD